MPLAEYVPPAKLGQTKRIGVAVLYFLFLPVSFLLAPLYLAYAVGTDRNGLGDAVTDSPLGAIPGISGPDWRSAAVVLVVVALLVFGAIAAGVPGEEEPQSGTAIDDVDDPDEAPSDGADEGEEVDRSEDAGTLEVHHLDVGQADSTLIVTPENETILIDTGDWRQDGSGVIAYLDERDVDRIDHLVATHGHADHIGGHAAVIEHYEEHEDGIGAAYDSGVVHDTATYENYLDAIDEYDVDLFEVREGDELPLEGSELTALILNPPEGEPGGDLHYSSIAIVFEFGEVRYLTSGDAEARAEERMIEKWAAELDADVYQAGHHGSSTSSTQPFLDAVDPNVTVISSDYDSQYGHPHDEVLDRFAAADVETYWTGVHGDVVLTTNGTEIDIEPAKDFSTDPGDIKEETPDDEDDAASIAPPMVNTAAGPLSG